MSRELSEEQMAQIRDALFKSRKIHAIKLYRDATGLGLREAKEFIDQLEAELRRAAPEEFAPAARSGCFAVLAMGCGIALGAAWRHCC